MSALDEAVGESAALVSEEVREWPGKNQSL